MLILTRRRLTVDRSRSSTRRRGRRDFLNFMSNDRLRKFQLEDRHPASLDSNARQPTGEAFLLLGWLDSFFLSHYERQPGDGRYWMKYYPLVTIPTTNKFSVCNFCELYKSKRDKAITRVEKAEAVEALQLHRKQQAEERAAAGRHRWKALDTPKDCAYIQIDGMDQKKNALPHFAKQPKSVDGVALVGVHLVGAMIFHGKLMTRAFLTYNNIKSDTNLTITVLHKILLDWEGDLPPVLYLQLDNTVHENKNNILFAYLAMLLERKVFTKIKLGFLMFSTDKVWEPPAGVRNIIHMDGSRMMLAAEQLPLKSYAEIKRQTRRTQNVGTLEDGDQGDSIQRSTDNEEEEPVAITTGEELRRRVFGERRPIYSGPRRQTPGSAATDRAAHIGELTEIHDKSFLAVLADDEISFWICQIIRIIDRNEAGEPKNVQLQWYTTEDLNPYTGN
ncbi:hypothetical protein R1sor_022219 [Riccia sorocarpa]|uniref:DUF7869 domain-containing protein n=1 Tax=Riccia sorocarpa TaxID=122646 RepID=A0ABD3GJ91_9MARC